MGMDLNPLTGRFDLKGAAASGSGGFIETESGPNTPISGMTAGAPALGTDLLPIARAGANYSLSLTDIAVFINQNGWERKGTADSSGALPTGPYSDGWAYFVSADGGTNNFLGTWDANCQPAFVGQDVLIGDVIVWFTGGFVKIDNTASGGALYIDLTRAAALVLIAGNTVSIGQNYRITDRRNCLLVGSGTNDFSMEGNMRITASEFFNTNEEFLDVKYDIVADEIQRYKDVRGNRLKIPISFSNLSAFLTGVRYGDINKTENEYKSSGLTFTAGDTINYSVFDFGATVSNSGAVTMNDTYVNSFLITTNTPTIQSCRLDNGIQALTVSGTSNLTRCIIDKPALGASITIFNETHVDKRCVSGFSNFETTLDITGLTTIDLTLRKLHGIVLLTTSNTIETIDLITNGQTNHPVDFVCRTNGKDIRFDTADQESVATADQIVGQEGVYYIKGSTITEDMITIKKDIGETVNYVTNVVNNDYQWITERSISRYDDFINAGALQTPAGWFGTITAGGSIAGSTTVPTGFYGLLTQNCTNAVNSAHSLTRGVSGIVQGTQGKAIFNGRFRIGSTLSDVTNVRNYYLGISDATTNGTEPLGGIYFRYTFLTGGNFWEAVSASGGVYTSTITTIPVTVNTAYDFKIVMNRNWTQAKYYIEGVLVATHNTNLPGAIQLSPKFSVRRELGTGTSRQIDGVGMQFYFNNPRI